MITLIKLISNSAIIMNNSTLYTLPSLLYLFPQLLIFIIEIAVAELLWLLLVSAAVVGLGRITWSRCA